MAGAGARAGYAWVWAAALAFFSGFYLLFVPAPASGGAAPEPGWLGAGLGTFGLASLAGRPVAGLAVDRFGERLVLTSGGLLLTASGLVACGPGGELAGLAARALLGLAYAAFSSAIGPAVARLVPPHRCPAALARSGIPANLAMGLIPAAAQLASSRLGPRGLLAGAGALGLASALLAWRIHPASPPGGGARASRARPSAGGMVWLFALTSLAGIAFATFTHVAPLALGSRAPIAFAIYAAGMVTGRALGTDLAHKLGLGLNASCALTGAGLAALAAAPPLAAVVAPALLAAGQAYQHPALLSQHLLRQPPARRGGGAARFYLAYDLGLALGAVPVALASGAAGARAVVAIGATVATAGLVLTRVHRLAWTR